MQARKLSQVSFIMLLSAGAAASDDHHAPAHAEPPKLHKIAEAPKADKPRGPVVAMDAEHARSVHAGELITAGAETMTLVGRSNLRVEISPRSVGEFDEAGAFRLLRGSAVVEHSSEASVRTPGAKVEFVGKAIVSYDHAEKSSSAFVLEGEARMVNPHRQDSSLKLARFRGATLVVGDVIPQLVRQLDIGGVNGWLSGFSWPAARRQALLRNMPGEAISSRAEEPAHLQSVKIEDYFSSIDTADEQQQPDYYERKFDDPDKVVAEANSKQGAGKVLSPEEAALISLPKTQIDLGFELGPEFLTADQKAAELRQLQPKAAVTRGPASVTQIKPKAVKKEKKAADRGDPDVNLVLERLRQVRSGNASFSQAPAPSRAPAAVREQVVPDPVYDYSQNF